jgi:hypothetical protein
MESCILQGFYERFADKSGVQIACKGEANFSLIFFQKRIEPFGIIDKDIVLKENFRDII